MQGDRAEELASVSLSIDACTPGLNVLVPYEYTPGKLCTIGDLEPLLGFSRPIMY